MNDNATQVAAYLLVLIVFVFLSGMAAQKKFVMEPQAIEHGCAKYSETSGEWSWNDE